LIAVSSRHIVQQRAAIIAFATKHRLPLAGGWGLWADTGALLSYGPDIDVMVRRAVGYVDRIVKGARPGSLPVEQPTTFELVLNRKTARALGITLPESVLAQADRVIQ
jgi:putative ABC transport system substrate-binding protein